MKKFDKKTGRVNVDKYLPHNFLAEKLVLCCLFFNSEAIEIAVQNLTVETFYFRNHQKIYQSILLLYEKKMVIDLVTVTTFLRDQGLLSQIGGIKILTDILNQIPNLAYLNDYITLLKDKYKTQIRDRDDAIERLKEMKAKLSTKMVGETLEQHCEIEFNKLRATAFQNSYFEKDNDSSSGGTKGDYIFKESDSFGNEIISLEMMYIVKR